MGKPIPKKVREAVMDRANNQCEGCGRSGPLELHHRRFRSRGGQHTVQNLVALCGWGNHTGCHGIAHSPKAPRGWAISQYERDEDYVIPFQSLGGLAWLTKDGRRILVGDTPF